LPDFKTPRSVSNALSEVMTQSGTGSGPRWVPRSRYVLGVLSGGGAGGAMRRSVFLVMIG
jgi:hypothetical protein